MKIQLIPIKVLIVVLAIFSISCSKTDQDRATTGNTFIGQTALNQPSPNSFEDLSWVWNYDQALTSASKENKMIMVDFYADWCGWCKRLDNETYRDAQVRERIKNFIRLKINTDNDKIIAQRYGIKSLPTILILDNTGREIKRQEGFLPGPQFLQLLL